jgi:glycosyltransferase involved in cell wall biosynthesis
MLKLSLIIPTYNRPKEINRLLSNLDFQTKKPDEVIIVDASHTEETRIIIDSKREKLDYPVYYYKYKKGLTLQRNYGVSKAKFEIVGFLDDDSLLEPNYLERIINMFEEDVTKNIGGASGIVFTVDYAKISLIDGQLKDISSMDDFSKLMAKYFPTNTNTNTYRSKIREGLEKILHLQSGEEGTYDEKRGKPIGIKTIFKGRKEVDFLRGIAFYRKEVFDYIKFPEFFHDYGYAEDLYFSLQVKKHFKLLVDGGAISYHLHAPYGRPNYFDLGCMTATNLFYIFKTFKNRNILNYLIFWFFFYLDAFLEVIPAFIGNNSLNRIKLFMGRFYGSFLTIAKTLKDNPIFN